MSFDYTKVDFANLNACVIDTKVKMKYMDDEFRQSLHDQVVVKHNTLIAHLKTELIEQHKRISKLESIIADLIRKN